MRLLSISMALLLALPSLVWSEEEAPSPAEPISLTYEVARERGAMAIVRVRNLERLLKNVQEALLEVQPLAAGFASPESLVKFILRGQAVDLETFDFSAPMGFVLFTPREAAPKGVLTQDACFLLPIRDGKIVEEILAGPSSERARRAGNYLIVTSPGALARAEEALGTVKEIPVADMEYDLDMVLAPEFQKHKLERKIEQFRYLAEKDKDDPFAEYSGAIEEALVELAKLYVTELKKQVIGLDVSKKGICMDGRWEFTPDGDWLRAMKPISAGMAPDLKHALALRDVPLIASFRLPGGELSRCVGEAIDYALSDLRKELQESLGEEFDDALDTAVGEIGGKLKALLGGLKGNFALGLHAAEKPAGIFVAGTKNDGIAGTARDIVGRVKRLLEDTGAMEEGLELPWARREFAGREVRKLQVPLDEKDALDIQLCQLPEHLVVTVGIDTDGVTERTIKSVLDKETDPASVLAMRTSFETKPGAFFEMHLSAWRIVEIVERIDAAQSGRQLTGSLASSFAKQDERIVFSYRMEGNRMRGEISVPLTPLKFIMPYAMHMAMKEKSEATEPSEDEGEVIEPEPE